MIRFISKNESPSNLVTFLKKITICSQSTDTPRILYSGRGSKIMIWRGIKYRINGRGAHKIRWRCTTHAKHGCKARVTTIDDTVINYLDDHITSGNEFPVAQDSFIL